MLARASQAARVGALAARARRASTRCASYRRRRRTARAMPVAESAARRSWRRAQPRRRRASATCSSGSWRRRRRRRCAPPASGSSRRSSPSWRASAVQTVRSPIPRTVRCGRAARGTMVFNAAFLVAPDATERVSENAHGARRARTARTASGSISPGRGRRIISRARPCAMATDDRRVDDRAAGARRSAQPRARQGRGDQRQRDDLHRGHRSARRRPAAVADVGRELAAARARAIDARAFVRERSTRR